MQEELTAGTPDPKPREFVSAAHHEEFFESDPGWEDVPELDEETTRRIRETIFDVVPGILNNAARQRCAVITTVGCQYVRYRRAGCAPNPSRRAAINRAQDKHDIGKSGVYEHVRALPIEGSTALISLLERTYSLHHRELPEAVRTFEDPCQKLVRVLSSIAAIDEAPPFVTSDVTIQDVYRDRPGERDRVLTADHDVIGLPRSDDEDRGAAVRNAEMVLEREDLETVSSDDPVHLTDNAKISTRDISTYDTGYSRVLRKIFEVVQNEMELYGKQKPGPNVGPRGDDNAAVRAVIPYPDSVDVSGDTFARLEVQYWESGSSAVDVTTHPLGRIYDEKDPSLSGPIETISKPGIYALIGETIDIAERARIS